MAFAAVIVLAAAANFLAEQGASIVVPRERVMVRATALPSAPAALPEPVRVESPPPVQTVSTATLVAAVDHFNQTVHTASQSGTPEDAEQLRQSAAHLAGSGEQLLQQLARPLPGSLRGLTRNIGTLSDAGTKLVLQSDERRRVNRDYVARVEAINERVHHSLDGSWKILGRVVARQSLLSLGTAIDYIRRRSGALATPSAYDDGVLAGIEAVESTFISTLEENARNFSRTDGSDWLNQMREDHSQMIRLRLRLVELDRERVHSERQLQLAREQILASLPAAIPVRTVASNASKRGVPESQLSSVASKAPGEVVELPPAPSNSEIDAAVLRATAVAAEVRNRRRHLVAGLSAAVLLIVISLSFATVRSIVGPVRRLMRATKELAGGALPAPLPRGGIKELDTLGVAFNDMAGRLAVAQSLMRDYQHDLENRVEQRTRELRTLAERDPLTMLPNRRQLFALLNRALAEAATRGELVGLFFVDIDNFKNLNDSVDHGFGDRVLVGIARRLESVAASFGFAARLGGDEFTVVHTRAERAEDIRRAGIALLAAFNEPLLVDDRELHVSISVGASVFPEHERDAEALLRAADAALFRAKALGRNQLNVFTPDLLRDMAEKFTTEQGLRRAVERGEFELVFQPELDLESMRVTLCEALVRWRLPDGRLATPQEFLAVAEESGLILDISNWVLLASVQAAAHWHHGAWPEACVAINISPRQLLDRQFTERLVALLAEYRLPPRCIELELTETVLQTGAATIETLRELRAAGIAIALDDFGTGYSTLASLEQLPVSRIKLDRSLIAGIDSKARSAAITRAIIVMCQGLDLRITAEGVERESQWLQLSEYGSLCVQGYLFSRPVAREELLAANRKVEQQAARLQMQHVAGALEPANALAKAV